MHDHPRVRGGIVARWISLVLGLFLFAFAIVLILGVVLTLWGIAGELSIFELFDLHHAGGPTLLRVELPCTA